MLTMMRRSGLALSALALALTLPLASSQARADVLVNGGFETGSLGPWVVGRNFGASEDWNVTSTVAHSGTFSATDVGNEELRQNFAATPTSSILDVSFWAEHPDANVNALAVDLYYSDGTDNEFLVNTTGTGWNFFDVTSHLTAGLSLTGFSVFGNSAGRTYFDDASITTAVSSVPEPGSFALGGVALGAYFLASVARRRMVRSRA